MVAQRYKLPIFVFICQVAFIFIFAFMGEYKKTAKPKNTDPKDDIKAYYPAFQDVNVMIFIGFGFLMTFLRRYGYSAVGFNFLVSVFVIQWATIIRGFLHVDVTIGEKFPIYINEMMSVDFCAAGVLISFGALIGRISPLQLLVMALIEVVLIQINEWICVEKLHAADAGESMYIHAFGAYFGMAASRVLYSSETEQTLRKSSYNSDLFSMIGTLFLWMYWPSFNGGAQTGDEQHRAVINTFYSLAACCMMTFALSGLFHKRGKFEMEHIQNATLAGGVAVGTCANMNIEPWGALVIGCVAAVVSMMGVHFVQPFFEEKWKIRDSCGVNNLHGMPGLLAGIGGAVAAALASEDKYGSSLYEVFPAMTPLQNGTEIPAVEGLGRSPSKQASYQIYALLLSLGVAIAGGIFTGALLRMNVWDNPKDDSAYDDSNYWHMEDEEEGHAPATNNQSYVVTKDTRM